MLLGAGMSFGQTISGTLSVCAGSNTTLTGAPTGGIWASSNPAIGTVGTSGVVTGISAGTATISYTVSSTTVTAVVSVNPLPAAITGSATICAGSTTDLISTTTGGIWSSSNTAIATVGSTTGVVTGISAGVTVISYTLLSTGCSVTRSETVNPIPPAITGGASVCVGATLTAGDAMAGGAWASGNAAVATINSSAVITGVAAGTAIISYVAATGCGTSEIVTVNTSPSITGISSICVGATLTLSPAGGWWSSANPAVAAISMTGGVVTGVATGTTVITYTTGAGCMGTAIVTVNALPAAISGADSLCLGATTTYTSATPGGWWTSSATAVASIGYSSGVATGIAAGTARITYTLPTGCLATKLATVNALPAAITGPATICLGSTITLSSLTTGGTWVSSNTPVATAGSSSGAVSGVAPGTASISYTSATGCGTSLIVTVVSTPVTFHVTGSGYYCPGTAGASVGLSFSSSTCDVYQLYNGATPVGTPVAGTGSTLLFGLQAAGVYSVLATSSCTGCSAAMLGTATVLLSPPVAVYSVTGGGSYCAGGTGVDVSLSGSESGTHYQLLLNGVATTTTLTGSGSSLDFGLQTTAGNYSVLATNLTGACTQMMADTVSVIANPLPGAITGTAQLCMGTTSTVSSATAGGSWSTSNSSVAYADAASGVITPVWPGTATISYTLPAGCYTTRQVTVNAAPSAIAGTTTFCLGSSTTLSVATGGGTWSSSNPAVAATGTSTAAAIVITPATSGTTTITYTGVTGCYSTAGLTINAPTTAGVIYGPTQVCEGATITLTATVSGGTWSSSVAFMASVAAATGVVTGNLAGGSTITYAVPGMCGYDVTTYDVAVNPTPAIITGYTSVCAAATITMTDASPGGTWASSTASVATIGYTSGIVSAIAPGTATITYTLSTGCYNTLVVTANPSPAAIGGSTSVCVGTMSTLSDATTGCVWSSTATGIASITSAGIVDAVSTGTTTISYTSLSGCAATIVLTINEMPAPITGNAPLCAGSNMVLGDTVAGGTWSSATIGVAEISTLGATPGALTGIAPGTAIITYALSSGCYVTAEVTVNALPHISATRIHAACGGTDTLVASGAGTYTWAPATSLSCTACAQPVFDEAYGGSYTITGTSAATGCAASLYFYPSVNSINGHLHFSTAAPGTADARVWLIQFNPADSTIMATDSVIACNDGGLPYYEFSNKPAGDYMVKAAIPGGTPGTSGYIPTYATGTAHWYDALTIAHDTAVNTADINMMYGTVPAGVGFIAGSVVSGAGKGTAALVPAAGMTVLLLDASGTVVTYTTTDYYGAFSFSHLADGIYTVYPEAFSYHTIPVEVSLYAGHDTINNINFHQHTTLYVISAISLTAVAGTSAARQVQLYPNPARNSIHMEWTAGTDGNTDIVITNVAGTIISRSSLPASARQYDADVASWASGMYIISISNGHLIYNSKFIVEH